AAPSLAGALDVDLVRVAVAGDGADLEVVAVVALEEVPHADDLVLRARHRDDLVLLEPLGLLTEIGVAAAPPAALAARTLLEFRSRDDLVVYVCHDAVGLVGPTEYPQPTTGSRNPIHLPRRPCALRSTPVEPFTTSAGLLPHAPRDVRPDHAVIT